MKLRGLMLTRAITAVARESATDEEIAASLGITRQALQAAKETPFFARRVAEERKILKLANRARRA